MYASTEAGCHRVGRWSRGEWPRSRPPAPRGLPLRARGQTAPDRGLPPATRHQVKKAAMSSYLRVPLVRSLVSGRRAREITLSWLLDAGRPGAAHIASLVVTELVTNAVLHAREPIALHLWRRDDGIRVGVSDGSDRTRRGPRARQGRPVGTGHVDRRPVVDPLEQRPVRAGQARLGRGVRVGVGRSDHRALTSRVPRASARPREVRARWRNTRALLHGDATRRLATRNDGVPCALVYRGGAGTHSERRSDRAPPWWLSRRWGGWSRCRRGGGTSHRPRASRRRRGSSCR